MGVKDAIFALEEEMKFVAITFGVADGGVVHAADGMRFVNPPAYVTSGPILPGTLPTIPDRFRPNE